MLIKKERIPVKHILLIGILPSFLKKLIYRWKGYKIDRNVQLSFGAVVIGKKVRIGEGVKVGFFTIVRGSEIVLERFARIGSMSVIDTERIFIDEDARINEQVYIGGMKTPESSFHLGKRAIIMQLSYLNPTLPISIGDDSGVGGHCLFFTHGSWNSQLEGYPVKFAPITLGKKVWLPWRVFIMPGVHIGDGVVIGANSLVGSDIPANSLAAGSPAKVIKSDFPKMPGQGEKELMLVEMFDAFFTYLQYFGYECKVSKDDSGFTAELTGEQQGSIHYVKNTVHSGIASKQTILVLSRGSSKVIKEHMKKGFGMCICMESLQREGSCAAGEELVAFLSRYGVRFSRL